MTDTIFMIHGMWAGPWYWENYRGLFENEGYRCITPALRYHDMDSKETPDSRLGTTSLLDYAQDLEQEVERLGVKPIIVGHSMGGLLAQILASRGLAKALVLLAPAWSAGILGLTPSVIKSFWSVMTTWGFWRKPVRQTFDEAVYSALHLLPPEAQKETYNRLGYESGWTAFEIGLWFLDARGASRVDASQVTCPVLVIGGGKDRIVPASVVRKVARKYEPLSTYKEFENHAHWLVAEPGWQEVAECVVGWLEEVSWRSSCP
ncbi:MAG: alpha/beta hydrolase [Chloroflexota bacterium]|nr:alpha/beta hydrolase [Chloroflexota bacterium]